MRHDQRYRTANGEILESLPGKNDSVWLRGSPQINPGDVLIDTYQSDRLFMVTAIMSATSPGRPYKVATLVEARHLVTVSRLELSSMNAFGRSVGGFQCIGERVPLVISSSTFRNVKNGKGSESLLVYSVLIPAVVSVGMQDRITFLNGKTFTVEIIDNSQPGLLGLRIIKDRR